MVSSKKTHCAHCQKKCSGNVLRYQDRYYHKPCFELEQAESSARAVAAAAAEASRERAITDSSRSLQVAGNAVCGGGGPRTPSPASVGARAATLPHSRSSPMGGFHMGAGASESNGNLNGNLNGAKSHQNSNSNKMPNRSGAAATAAATCAGCRERISDGQALIALDLHWHVWCFKCAQCKAPLHGEYVAKEGRAYCERDYQRLYGIACVYCKRYITGKVLQAGDAHHFHPSCARCSKCGDPFVPGEEMYLQGEVTWHPRCGPAGVEAAPDAQQHQRQHAHSPSLSSRSRSRSASPFFGTSAGGGGGGGGAYSSRSNLYGRAASPAAPYADSEPLGDLSRVYTISYLNADPNQGYLRRPVEPYPPKSPQFSRPTSLSRLGGGGAQSDPSRCSSRSQQYIYAGSGARERSVPRGMYSVLSGGGGAGSSLRARSPSMMNEEAIALSSYPSGQKPAPDSVPTIERDDFPAPPFPYPDHRHQQRAHSRSGGSRASSRAGAGAKQQVAAGPDANSQRQRQRPLGGERASRPRSRELALSDGDSSNGSLDSEDQSGERQSSQRSQQSRSQQSERRQAQRASDSDSQSASSDPQFLKEEEELSKIANGIGKIFLQTLKEREKLRAWKRANLDPRNASRTPSATRELPARLRYENPTNASPSRDLDRPRAWTNARGGFDELDDGDQSPTRTRSSLGRSTALSGSTPTAAGPAAAAATTPSALSSSYGYKVVQANRSTPRPGYGLAGAPGSHANGVAAPATSELSFADQQRVAQARAHDLLLLSSPGAGRAPAGSMRSLASSAAHLRRSMPNVAQLQSGPASQHPHHLHNPDQLPKLYPYHLLATTNYRLPPGVDRCHLERHLSNEEFQYIFHCDRLDFYRLPEWKRNELKRRARLF